MTTTKAEFLESYIIARAMTVTANLEINGAISAAEHAWSAIKKAEAEVTTESAAERYGDKRGHGKKC